MKNVLFKGVIIAGIAVGIAAISVAVQRYFAPTEKDIDDDKSTSLDDDDDLDIILKDSLSSNTNLEKDEILPAPGLED